MQVNNHYWVLRHGRSLANEAAIIVSSMENGVKEEYGLAQAGKQQAQEAGLLLKQQLAAMAAAPNSVHIFSSPFSRTLQTAALAAEAAGLDAAAVQATPLLAERFFGSRLELACHDNYCPAWEGDAADPASKPAGCQDGESVEEVSARVTQLFQELEQQYHGQHILLVSHGDTLSILQATFHGSPLTQHRRYGLGTAELRPLRQQQQQQQQQQQLPSATTAAAAAAAATAAAECEVPALAG